jgi:hypothetical protein
MDGEELRRIVEAGGKGPLITLLVAIEESKGLPEDIVALMVEAARRMIAAVPNPNATEQRIAAMLFSWSPPSSLPPGAHRPVTTTTYAAAPTQLDPQAYLPLGADSVSVMLEQRRRWRR